MADADRSEGLRWWGWAILLAGLALVAALVVWFGFAPDSGERAGAVTAVCRDAQRLRKAGLLAEARTVDGPIAAHGLRCRSEQRRTIAREARAAYFREVGDQYVRAAKLTRAAARRAKTADQQRRARFFEHARRVDLRRALKAYRRSFWRNPYDPATNTGLTTALGLLPVPPDAGADARCAIARRLRHAHALDAAATVYAQALRTGRTGLCEPEDGLRRARTDRLVAVRRWRRAEAAAHAGHKTTARRLYVAALRRDPSLAEAKKALDATKGPDPRAHTRHGQLAAAGHWFAGLAATGKSVGSWLADHETAVAVGAALAAVLLLLAMCLLFFVTRWERVRRAVARLHLPAFCRPQPIIKPFTPAGSDTSTTVFAYWLGVPLVGPAAPGSESSTDLPDPLEAWEATAESDSLATLFEAQPGVLAALVAWVRRIRPRRETHFVGYALDRCEHGPGLRALVKTRRGRVQGAEFWWATDLPGPPLTTEDEVGEARHALAIYAATWARDTAGMP